MINFWEDRVKGQGQNRHAAIELEIPPFKIY